MLRRLLVLDQVDRRGAGHGRLRRRLAFGRARGRGARQQLPRLIADGNAAIRRGEAADQADFLRLAVDFVPGDVNAVGVAQLRLAVVFFEILGGKNVFPVRTWVGFVAVRFVEGVDRQSTFDLDRLDSPFLIEHQPSAKATFGHLSRFGSGCVGPKGHEFELTAALAGVFDPQGHQAVHEIELRAARSGGGQTDDDQNEVFHACSKQQSKGTTRPRMRHSRWLGQSLSDAPIAIWPWHR